MPGRAHGTAALTAYATEGAAALTPRAATARVSPAWLGVVPSFTFALLFLMLPTAFLTVGAFHDVDGRFTLVDVAHLFQPGILSASWISIEVSVASALGGGGLLGFAPACAVVLGGRARWIRPTLMTFCGVASNFAGSPLAFAFPATLGRTGRVTAFLTSAFDFNIHRHGSSVLSFVGLMLTYLYFQIPLMVLILTPALDGLKVEWREASPSCSCSAFCGRTTRRPGCR